MRISVEDYGEPNPVDNFVNIKLTQNHKCVFSKQSFNRHHNCKPLESLRANSHAALHKPSS